MDRIRKVCEIPGGGFGLIGKLTWILSVLNDHGGRNGAMRLGKSEKEE